MGTEQEQLVKAEELLQALMNASEKAANIARACRGESTLFSLLVEEKKDSEKNKRFFQDFKTLADVLVQECVSHDVSQRFPGIEKSIQGEESNQFTNTLGESICVKVMATEAETENLLAKVLDGNNNAAVLLANLVHKDINNSVVEPRLDSSIQLPLNDIGIWIDPIDSTSEYVNGQWEKPGVFGIASSGLQSVCVLIGVYSLLSGAPVLGVVNQPFYAWNYSLNRWTGRCIWGFCHQKTTFNVVEKLLHNVSSELAANTPLDKSVMTISGSEALPLVSALKDKYEVVFAAGAGYKVLSVASGLANLYLLTKGSTFRWDTCAPHAILRSLGGGVINLKQALGLPLDSLLDNEENLQLIYNCPEEGVRGIDRWCNVDGFIAYRDTASLLELIQFLKEVNLKP
ncbi:inositol polyphosphate 1-phosphatase [Tachypleus tridentatus]|uniref:inositol polyphosphate 1-phosphatase n=1 Tax=Tachypleus tridentatus TaxID=6853 RepID=UPI003FD00037